MSCWKGYGERDEYADHNCRYGDYGGPWETCCVEGGQKGMWEEDGAIEEGEWTGLLAVEGQS